MLAPDVAVRLGPERFLREVNFASTITHPHIVPIYAAGDADGLACYHAWTGNAAAALDWLSRAFSESPTGVEVRVYESELFDALLDEPMSTRVAEQIRLGVWGQRNRTVR